MRPANFLRNPGPKGRESASVRAGSKLLLNQFLDQQSSLQRPGVGAGMQVIARVRSVVDHRFDILGGKDILIDDTANMRGLRRENAGIPHPEITRRDEIVVRRRSSLRRDGMEDTNRAVVMPGASAPLGANKGRAGDME